MRLSALLICLLAAPAALAGKASQRPLRRSAVAFNDCCKGSDIDMSKFLHAGKQFCELAAQFGRFAVPSASEVRRCIQKIEQALHKLASQGSRTHCKTMRALLQAEVAPKRGESALALRGPCGQPAPKDAHRLARRGHSGPVRQPSPLGRVSQVTAALSCLAETPAFERVPLTFDRVAPTFAPCRIWASIGREVC